MVVLSVGLIFAVCGLIIAARKRSPIEDRTGAGRPGYDPIFAGALHDLFLETKKDCGRGSLVCGDVSFIFRKYAAGDVDKRKVLLYLSGLRFSPAVSRFLDKQF